jgi:hypothetical protein
MSRRLTNLRLVKMKSGSLGWDGYTPPTWAVLFERNGQSCRVDVRIRREGASRPTGQEVLDAMRDFLRRREVTEHQLFDDLHVVE